MRLSDLSQNRDNNLNLVRVCAAVGVLISHAYPIALGQDALQPLQSVLGVTLGTVSVYVFFVISGFLITQSFDRSRYISNWLSARIMRIFPGLLVAVSLTALVLGPALTTHGLAAYLSDPAIPGYLLRNLTLVSLQYELPGVFQDNPYGGAINGSLWTLVHEVACYIGVLIVGVLGLIRSRWGLSAALLLYLAGYLVLGSVADENDLPHKIAQFRNLSLPFAIGTAFYAWRDKIRVSWLIGFLLLPAVYVSHGTALQKETFVLVLAYWILLVSFLPGGALRLYNKIGDYSYGVYIYAFPMQQLIASLFDQTGPVQNMLLALPLTVLLAAASWHYVEKPSLGLRTNLALFFRTLRPPRRHG